MEVEMQNDNRSTCSFSLNGFQALTSNADFRSHLNAASTEAFPTEGMLHNISHGEISSPTGRAGGVLTQRHYKNVNVEKNTILLMMEV